MQSAVSPNSNSYSSYSYYDIEAIAIDNWHDFNTLLGLHNNALGSELKVMPVAIVLINCH